MLTVVRAAAKVESGQKHLATLANRKTTAATSSLNIAECGDWGDATETADNYAVSAAVFAVAGNGDPFAPCHLSETPDKFLQLPR